MPVASRRIAQLLLLRGEATAFRISRDRCQRHERTHAGQPARLDSGRADQRATPSSGARRRFRLPILCPGRPPRVREVRRRCRLQAGAFIGWRTFNSFVAKATVAERSTRFQSFRCVALSKGARLWSRRSTDEATGGQPPLKDKFQATFQMTLLGNVVLSRLWESNRYRVLPFSGGRGAGEVIEVFPGATLRRLGLPRYKSKPGQGDRAEHGGMQGRRHHTRCGAGRSRSLLLVFVGR